MRGKDLAAGLAALLLAAGAAANTKVTVSGSTQTNGIFDPSVEYAGSPTGWLAYSAVYGSVTPFGPSVETRLARSDDNGGSWTFETVVNPSTPGTLQLLGGGELTGFWNTEVASLVYDPDDSGREWKIFAHRIFRDDEDDFTTEQNQPAYSWISLTTAPQPEGPWTEKPPHLSAGHLPPPPYDVVEHAITLLDPSLAGLDVYSEPGAFHRDGTLYLSLTGLTPSGPDRIVLLASDDHAASWRYLSTPLTNVHAASLGYLSFDGSAIVEQQGRVFLMVAPESPGVLHDGTLVFEFDDLAAGTLVASGGVPQPLQHIPPASGLPPNRRGGQADYHDGNTAGGILQPSLQAGEWPELFQIFATGELPAGPAQVPALSMTGRAALALLVMAAAAAARSER